jgi:hypothetical protein
MRPLKRVSSYDSKCWDLAIHFLADEPALQAQVNELAGHIQTEIESWIEYENRRLLYGDRHATCEAGYPLGLRNPCKECGAQPNERCRRA